MRRTSEREVVVHGVRGPMLEGAFEALCRSKGVPFRAGDEVRPCGARYRVEAVEDGRPTEIRLTLDVPLEDPSLQILRWDGERLVPVTAPPVGGSATIAWSPGPLGMF